MGELYCIYTRFTRTTIARPLTINKQCLNIIRRLNFKVESMAREYEGRINLKSGGNPVIVTVTANTPSEAKKILEAQYSGQIKSWFTIPHEK